VAAPAASAPGVRRQQIEVLFLSTADPDLPDVAAMIEQTETHIVHGSDRPVHFNFEYLESPPSFEDAHKRATASYLLQKYRGQTFDLVIAINEETLALGELIRAKLFPDAALLFSVVNPRDPASWLNQKPGRTGVIRELNYLPTLQLALLENPGTSHVVVVSGCSDAEKLDVKIAREQFRPYESNLDFQYLTDLPFSELGPRLAHVQPDSIIVFLDFITDSSGEQFIPARILPAIAKTANRPIYGTFSSVVGAGVVGGSVADLGQVGQILGNDGARILRGEKPESIPVVTGDFQHYVIDWRQLHRWGIPESELPKDAEVRYWQYSPWALYRWRILGLSALLLIETLLIILLLRNIAKRKRAQETLRRKEEDLAEAQHLARVGNWFWDPQNKSLTWSDELYRIHGLDPSLPPPTYEELSQLFTPDSWEHLRAAMEETSRSGSIRELDLELVRADGSHRWVTARGMAVRDASGRVSYRGTAQDITERRLAEETRLRLASIVESSNDAIISKNIDGIIVTWNLGAKHIFGFSEAEAVGQPIGILVPPELREEEEMLMHKARVGEKVEHYETIRLTKEGKKINVSLTLSPVRDATGRIVGASKIARDITERKRVEEELKRSEERFSKAFRQSPMALSLANARTHRYLDINKTFERIWGYARPDVIGKSALELGLWVNPADSARLTQKLQSEGSLRDVEFEWRAKDGRVLSAVASVELIEIDGEPCFLAVVADISDQKAARAVLTDLSRRLIQAGEEESSRIARELHDDINQRLALLANGLQEVGLSTSAKSDPSLKKELQELWQLTSEIATDIQHMSHQLHPSKLHYLGIAATLRDLCHEVTALHKIKVECVVRDLPDDLDKDTSLSLFRVVQESLRNVVKHSHAGHVKVELTCQSSVVQLRVSDDGIGFNPDDIRKKHGLGLINMRERLRSVGGEFSIWSKPSLGTQVEGRVPVTRKLVRRAEEPAADRLIKRT